MKENLRFLFRLVALFGIIYGIRLFLNIKFLKLRRIKVPGIKSTICLRKGTSDIPTFFQVFLYHEYEINFTSNPQVIIDGGANIGMFTVFIKNKFPEAKVISIEPDSENFETLQKNVSEYQNISCENYGLWNKETNLKVHDKLKRGKWGMIVEETSEKSNVKALSIDALMSKYSLDKIDILKLDIETSEKNLFSSNYENWLPRTRMLIVELHDFMEEGCAKAFFEAINKTFTNYEYHIKGENTIIINKDIP